MPKRLTVPSNFFALEEQFQCEKKAAAAAARTSDGKPAGFTLPPLFIETAGAIGRHPAWRPIAMLYFDRKWAFVRRRASAGVRAASKQLARASTEDAKKVARLGVDKASQYRTLATVLNTRVKDAKRIHFKGAHAFRRAILGAAKEAERCQTSTSGKIRDAIRKEGFERHMAQVFRELNPRFGLPVPPDNAPPFDCWTVRERVKKECKLATNFSDELIRKANMRQRNSPKDRQESIPPALKAALARGRKCYGSPPTKEPILKLRGSRSPPKKVTIDH